MNWFRFYTEAIDDPKVQRLSGDRFKAWVNVLCLAGKHDGALPDDADIAFALRLSPEAGAALMRELTLAGLIDDGPDGRRPHNWYGRQPPSDSSAKRTQRYREHQRHGGVTPDHEPSRLTSNEASHTPSPSRHSDAPDKTREEKTRSSTTTTISASRNGVAPALPAVARCASLWLTVFDRGATPKELAAVCAATAMLDPPASDQRLRDALDALRSRMESGTSIGSLKGYFGGILRETPEVRQIRPVWVDVNTPPARREVPPDGT